jgi:hypothetical protein
VTHVPTIEDELRAVLRSWASQPSPEVDRLTETRRRIARRRCARGAVTAAVVVLLTVAGLGTWAGLAPDRSDVSPTINAGPSQSPTPERSPGPPANPGPLPADAGGGRLTIFSTAIMPKQTSIRFVFTPTTLDMTIGSTCVAADAEYQVHINGHLAMNGACDSSGLLSTTGPQTMPQGSADFWSYYGVALGGEVTITASVRLQNSKAPAESLIGTMSIGEYVVPPFDTSALPSRPPNLAPIHGVEQMGDYPSTMATVPPHPVPPPARAMPTLLMPRHIQVLIALNSPGRVVVTILNRQVMVCESRQWGRHECASPDLTTGKGLLRGLRRGDVVLVTASTQNLSGSNTWAVKVVGDRSPNDGNG